jgi:hypothetical protein
MRVFLLFTCFLLVTALLIQVRGQAVDPQLEEDDEPRTPGAAINEEEDEKENEAEGVTLRSIFPHQPDKKFGAGVEHEVLIGFENQNENAFHIEFVRGLLTLSVDFNYFVQNFTGALYNVTVPSGQEVSLVYHFKPDVSIEARQYGLVLQVFYTNDDNETYLSPAFNGTIEIFESRSAFDGKAIFANITIIGILVLAGFAGYKYMTKGGKKHTQRPRAASTSEAEERPVVKSEGVDWDYISQEHQQFVSKNRKPSLK